MNTPFYAQATTDSTRQARRFAPRRSAPPRSTPWRFASRRSAPRRFGRVSGCASLHSFRLLTPCRRSFTCSGFAIESSVACPARSAAADAPPRSPATPVCREAWPPRGRAGALPAAKSRSPSGSPPSRTVQRRRTPAPRSDAMMVDLGPTTDLGVRQARPPAPCRTTASIVAGPCGLRHHPARVSLEDRISASGRSRGGSAACPR